MKAYSTECPICLERIEYGGSPANEPFARAAHHLEHDCRPAKDEKGRLVFGSRQKIKKYTARMKELMGFWRAGFAE